MKKVLFLANHFITLYSFRRELIKDLLEDGNLVYLSIPEDEQNKYFEELGCVIINTKIDRRGVNPIKDIWLILQYKKIINDIKPDIIFSYTIKPNIYGSLVSNKKYKQICNITGTGATFLKKNFISAICKFLYKISVKNCYKVFFQNTGDRDFFIQNKMVKNNYDIIPGSGCNLVEHPYSPLPDIAVVRFIFIGRIMKVKGIDEYLEAARIIKSKYSNTEFLIAGWIEESRYEKIIKDYVDQSVVKYIGFRNDIADWIAKCHCTVLPSHGGEGVPNVLLESASTGRICIGSNINGTIDVIEDGKTGFVFEKGSTSSLVKKIQIMLNMTKRDLNIMSINSRNRVETLFERKIIINKYKEELYK